MHYSFSISVYSFENERGNLKRIPEKFKHNKGFLKKPAFLRKLSKNPCGLSETTRELTFVYFAEENAREE